MPKTSAPFEAPEGKKWCPKCRSFKKESQFPENYGYCLACKRAYQRKWDKERRVRKPRSVEPRARLSKSRHRILVYLPNTEEWRKKVEDLLGGSERTEFGGSAE